MEDQELKAMNEVHTLLRELDDASRSRVLNWLFQKFSHSGLRVEQFGAKGAESTNYINEGRNRGSDSDGTQLMSELSSISDLFAIAEPKSESQKVLLVATFLHQKLGLADLTSRSINDELKHMGHGVSNITATINSLINRKPKLMIQTRKEGKSKQSQKKYKVTVEGINSIKEMIKKDI